MHREGKESARRHERMFLSGCWEQMDTAGEGESRGEGFGRGNRSGIGRGACANQRRPGHTGPHSTCRDTDSVPFSGQMDRFSSLY